MEEEQEMMVCQKSMSRGSLIGGIGGISGGIVGGLMSILGGSKKGHAQIAFITGSTLASFVGISFAAIEYKRLTTGKVSLLDSFVGGSIIGGFISFATLGIRGPVLVPSSLYLGLATCVVDYCILKAIEPHRLKANNDGVDSQGASQIMQASKDKTHSSFWWWMPVIGEKAKKIDQLIREIEELEGANNKGYNK